MSEFFLTIVNMSISASWIVLAVLLLRLLLGKAPKWVTVLLWGIVAVRLICPFTVESVMSLIPSAETISPGILIEQPEINTGFPVINNTLNPIIQESTVTIAPEKSVNTLKLLVLIFSKIWFAGIVLLLAYTAISYWRVKRKTGTAVLLRDNIYQSETVVSPFVLGIIKPKIYLPFNISEQDMEHVIAHEQAHIRRKDHIWKPLGFLLLTLHWFNPLMWLGYVLLCRDIELACDEKVIKELNTEQKADYSQALLTCSVNRRMIAACPLAFGEVGVKDRVKSVLNYKKPAFWIIVVAIAASIAVAVCFLTNPINTSDRVLNKLMKLKGYEVIEQDMEIITLSVPLSVLPDSIYTEEGAEFEDHEVIAYQDTTTSIYLKKARYSNEGNEYLYFCFDFAFNLPKKQGVLLYPYIISDDGFTGCVKTVNRILRTDNGAFADAVQDRGQGTGNLIWFYVSTDALMQAQGTIHFDILLNQITYFLDGNDYSSVSNVSGTDTPANIITDVDQLKAKFPMYFDLATTKGLEVYIWQLAEDSYSCGLLTGKNLGYTQEELWDLHKSPASIDEMRAIIAYYISNGEVTKNEVTIHAIQMPHSSYAYTIDDAYRQRLNEFFWSGNSIVESSQYSLIIDTATFDIDGDGKEEQCLLRYGPTSGLFTFIFSASENGVLEYFNIFTSPYLVLSFERNSEGQIMLVGKGSDDHVFYMGIEVYDGNIIISSDDQDVFYWGEQGVDSPYAPKP